MGTEREMTPEEIDAYLREARIADLAELRPDGSPHVTPIWYQYDGARFLMLVDPTSVKARNIMRDPRVSISIATEGRPYRYILVDGRAEVLNEDYTDLLFEMSVHYLGRDEGTRYAKSRLEDATFCIISVTPSKMTTFAYEGTE